MSLPNYKGIIHSIVQALHPRNATEYDEYISVANLGYVKALNTYEPTHHCKLSTYTWMIIRYELLSYIKKDKRQTAILQPHKEYTVDTRLSDILCILSTKENDIINLRRSGYTFAEIGKHYHISDTYAHTLYHKIIHKLRSYHAKT